jgi:predicted RNase H-like HicB family nuclease
MEMEVDMQYPIVIHKDKKSDYGVTVPDLPGCFSAGSTIDEALAMAREAIELHIEGLIEEGMVVPEPNLVDRLRKKAQYAGGVWAVVDINPSKFRKRSKRVNITLPQRVLDSIDRFAESHGETRSGLLTKAVANYIAERKKSA